MITSAYNFVPLQRRVLQPDWQDSVCQDVPLQDGVCAELDIVLVNHTPLLVAGSDGPDDRTKRLHMHPDGVPTIPGASLRGMIRSVMEVVTSARMQFIDDRALSLRDLYLKDYMQRMQRTPEAGWLRFDPDLSAWVIKPVDLEFIDHSTLERIGRYHSAIYGAWQKASNDEKRQASLKYRAVGKAIVLQRRGGVDGTGNQPETVPKKGWVVFTGQPSALDSDPNDHRPHTKHREFIFFDREPAKDSATHSVLLIPGDVMRRFLQVHDQSADWAYLSGGESVLRKVGIPVFYHRAQSGPSKGMVESLGLAMMYRIPGRRTLGEIARAQQASRPDPNRLDFVETLFGCIDDGVPGRISRRSRVSFGDLRWCGPGERPAMADAQFRQPTLLGQPKPSFYPSYLVQKLSNGTVVDFKTILSDKAELRGWKRYPVRPLNMVEMAPPNKDNPQVNVQLEPLAPSQEFKGRIRLHNVKLEELGAVLWCLTWGGDASLRHSLGMGKAFGFGQVALQVTALQVRHNDPSEVGSPDAQVAVDAFQAWMTRENKHWRNDLQELLAMANPSLATADRLRPLRLDAKMRLNQFKEAKQSKQALQPYSAGTKGWTG